MIAILFPLIAAGKDKVRICWPLLGKEVEAFDSMMEHAAFVDMPKHDMKAIASRLYVSANTQMPGQAHARICFWQGLVTVKDNPDSAMLLAEKALALCDSAKYPYDHARFSLLKAECFRYKGSYANAYFIYRDKIELLKGFGDDFWMAKAMVCVGVILQDLGEYHEANTYYLRAQELFEKAGSFACCTKNRINLANISYLLGEKEKGLSYIEGLERNKYVSNDSIYVANVCVSRFHISEYADKSAACRAYEISLRIRDDNLSVISTLALGISNYKEGRCREAINLFRSAYAIAEEVKDFKNKKLILEGLEGCYRKINCPDSASMCHDEVLLLNDSIYYQESIASLKRAEHLSTINGYERSIRQQREQHRMRSIFTMSLIALLFVVLILSLWLLYATKRKNASERRLQEEKTHRLELLNRQYSLEIEAKEKELASNTMILAQKNAKLKDLAEQIRMMEQHGEIAMPESRRLSEHISNELSADDDWKFFKLRFDKVHPLFFSSLKESYPSLSKTELRLCAYIRVGMSAKEIAQVLPVRPETVNTSRYRIRKKMGLDQHTSLDAILENY